MPTVVARLVELCLAHPSADESAIESLLVGEGVSEAAAFEAVTFACLAYGHAIADRCGLERVLKPSYALFRSGATKSEVVPLDSRPAFAEGLRLARAGLARGQLSEELLSVANRSPHFRMVHESLRTSNPAVDSILLFMEPEDDDDSAGGPAASGATARPWWKFW